MLKANGTTFNATALQPELVQLAFDAGLINAQGTEEIGDPFTNDDTTDDSSIYTDADVIVKRIARTHVIIRGEKTTIVDDLDFPISFGVNLMNCRHKYNRLYKTERARIKHQTAPDKADGSFDAFLYKKGSTELAFITDDKSFVKDFINNNIFSFTLTAVFTDKTLKATEYDVEQRELRWELNSIITKSDNDYSMKVSDKNDIRDFKRMVFNKETFVSNPEAVLNSPILEKIMNGSF